MLAQYPFFYSGSLFSPYSQPIRIANNIFAWSYWWAKHETHIFWFNLQQLNVLPIVSTYSESS